jgi:hAT family C-terminal dimerisation region
LYLLSLVSVKMIGILTLGCLNSPRNTGKSRLVGCGVMTLEQYTKAETGLVMRLQLMRENESGVKALIATTQGSTTQTDAFDDEYEHPISSEQQEAYSEWWRYCRLVKGSRHFPKSFKPEGLLEIGPIRFGVVVEPGDDIDANPPFKKCNLADFIDKTGYFNLVKFLGFNRHVFPFLYKLACCLAATRMNEVGCERFFSIAGYVSNPRRTKLKVRHYEAMAMLKRNMQQIYIDEDWVVEQYTALEKTKTWDSLEVANDRLVGDLEAEIFAEEIGVPVEALRLEDLQEDDGDVAPIEVDDSDTSVELES